MNKFKNPSIAIVEDDPAYAKLTEKNLRLAGYTRIKLFTSGNEFIEKLSENKIDIVLQDFEMPGISGLATMKQAKKIYPDMEFIMLSGQSSVNVAVETLREGAFDYVVKDETAFQNVFQKVKKVLMIKKLQYDKKMSDLGRKVFLILLIATWVLIALLYYMGMLKEVII